MLRNYIKTTLRNFLKHKLYTGINISGLTLGITCMLIMYIMVDYLTSFDTYHRNRDHIYRFVTRSVNNGVESFNPGVPMPLVEAVKLDFPEFEKVSFIRYKRTGLVTVNAGTGNEKTFQEDRGIAYSDDLFYQIFDRDWLAGDKLTSLKNPNSVVLSERIARKYFETLDVLGKEISIDNMLLQVTGVMEDYPEGQTDLPFDVLISFSTIESSLDTENWGDLWSDFQCYALLKEGVDISEITYRIPDFESKYLGFEQSGPMRHHFELQPLKDLHFDRRYSNYNYRSVSRESVWVFIILGLFLLVTACINFINLSTAQAVTRSKEVGVRKVLGSRRGMLIIQFLGETFLITLASFIFSLGLTELALIKINSFLTLDLHLDLMSNMKLWMYMILLLAGVTILAGLYPAWIISGSRPILAIKNQTGGANSKGLFLRRGLVIFQFVITQVLIIGIVIISSQMNFVRNAPMGFTQTGILNVYLPTKDHAPREALGNKIAQLPQVGQFSFASASPASNSTSRTNFYYEKNGERLESVTMIKIVDHQYISTFGLELIAGTTLPQSDTVNAYVINESALKLMQYKNAEDVLGQPISIYGKKAPVVGVVKDFHTTSLKNKIEPTILYSESDQFRLLGVNFTTDNISELQSNLQSAYNEVYPEYEYNFEFIDEVIRNFYRSETRMASMLKVFTGISVFIGCLGLLGLVSFMANQKVKEIGIRKVMGAEMINIITIFLKEFVRLILLAFIIAAPVAYLGMESWLQEFSYRITQSPVMFITAISITLIIAFITVGYQSLKSSLANPVDSLRNE